MLTIAVQPVPSQTVTATLGGQPCKMTIYQKSTGLFMDVYLNGSPIIVGVLCQNANPIVREAYLGFVGDLTFLDTQGLDPPYYSGLGSRWILAYLQP